MREDQAGDPIQPTSAGDSELQSIDLKNPDELKRMQTASEIMNLMFEDGLSVQEACDRVGIGTATYYRWVNEGVFVPFNAKLYRQIEQDTVAKVLAAWPKIIEIQVATALGVPMRDGETVYQRDTLAAAKFLHEKVIGPASQNVGKPSADEQEFLRGKQGQPKSVGWAAQLIDANSLGRGDKVTISIERSSDPPIDVTPED
jgi:predicted DNA-binding transcriptional regulator AlpA